VAWAIAGRDPAKLAQVRDRIGAPVSLPLIRADASDASTLAAMAAQARVVISTVGPYQLHGEPLVRACAAGGTDYVDLCGEPLWMARMIAALDAPARASGARIVFSCGFDSIPFDLGVLFLQEEARRRFGAPLARVRGRVRVMKGTFSGGTMASALATIVEMRRDPAAARAMADPFALTPGFRGPRQPWSGDAEYDDAATSWTAPFVMAAINTKNVHRTNALLGHPWGRDFVYDERMATGDGERGASRARRLARVERLMGTLLGFAPTRELLRRFALPKPGEGPDRAARERGRYEIEFIGDTAQGQRLRATVKGDRDPGYGSTSKIIAEAALCLVRDVEARTTRGGVWTPGAAMGTTLVLGLQERAGLAFAIED
jgi:short subunit dehydrogenase-like uncharacterized protein